MGALKNLYVMAPRQVYFKNTVGLVGIFDDDKSDDITFSNHTIIEPAEINADTLKSFAESCKYS